MRPRARGRAPYEAESDRMIADGVWRNARCMSTATTLWIEVDGGDAVIKALPAKMVVDSPSAVCLGGEAKRRSASGSPVRWITPTTGSPDVPALDDEAESGRRPEAVSGQPATSRGSRVSVPEAERCHPDHCGLHGPGTYRGSRFPLGLVWQTAPGDGALCGAGLGTLTDPVLGE